MSESVLISRISKYTQNEKLTEISCVRCPFHRDNNVDEWNCFISLLVQYKQIWSWWCECVCKAREEKEKRVFSNTFLFLQSHWSCFHYGFDVYLCLHAFPFSLLISSCTADGCLFLQCKLLSIDVEKDDECVRSKNEKEGEKKGREQNRKGQSLHQNYWISVICVMDKNGIRLGYWSCCEGSRIAAGWYFLSLSFLVFVFAEKCEFDKTNSEK